MLSFSHSVLYLVLPRQDTAAFAYIPHIFLHPIFFSTSTVSTRHSSMGLSEPERPAALSLSSLKAAAVLNFKVRMDGWMDWRADSFTQRPLFLTASQQERNVMFFDLSTFHFSSSLSDYEDIQKKKYSQSLPFNLSLM